MRRVLKKKRRSFLKTYIYEDDNDESIEPVLTETVDWSHDESLSLTSRFLYV